MAVPTPTQIASAAIRHRIASGMRVRDSFAPLTAEELAQAERALQDDQSMARRKPRG